MAVIRQTKWPPEGHDREAVLLPKDKDMCSPVTAHVVPHLASYSSSSAADFVCLMAANLVSGI